MDDRQLLQEYAEQGSEQAFKTLVERHLGLVHSAARRQVNDAQLAEDVSQAVFALLARKAGSLPRESRLSGWLYQTTCFVARRAVRSEIRRRERERIASAMPPHEASSPQDLWNDIAPHLDEAMERLSAKDRQALLIRYFESRTHRDVADALGIGEEAAKKRTNRALEKLRTLLRRSGVAVSGISLAATLGEHGVEAAPAGLAGVIAPSGGAAGAAGVAARVPGLVEETLRAWRWVKMRWIAGMLTGSAVLVTLVATLVPNRGPQASNATGTDLQAVVARTAATEANAPAARVATTTTHIQGEPTLVFRVVDEATGNGVGSARVVLQRVANGEWTYELNRTTDAAGFAEIGYPKDTMRMDVGLLENGWVARYATFLPHVGEAIPAEYSLRVARSVTTQGGWVRDEHGAPVAGAEIGISFDNTGDASNRETPRERNGCPIWRALVATTDANGRWTMTVTPPGLFGYSLVARHPDYAVGSVIPETWTGEPGSEASPSNGRRWSTVLRRGGQIAGRVLGPDGLPVAGAAVRTDVSSVDEQEIKTDRDGRFALPRMEEGSVEFTVMAPGLAPEVRTLQVHPGLPPIDIVLRPGGMLRLALVDEAGLAVPGAEVILEQWKEYRHRVKWRAFADAAGRVVWDGAPPEGELDLCVRGNGWCYTRNSRVEASDDDEHRIEMRRELRLKGSVIDAVTRRPLAEFKAFPGYGTDEHCWERLDTRRGAQGGFEIVFSEKRDPWRVRIEAEGYLPFISEPIAPDTDQPLAVALQPIQPGTDIVGSVTGPDGAPAAGAEVALLTLEHDARLGQRGFLRTEEDPRILTTDASGKFRFPADPTAHSVAVARQDGFGIVRFGSSREPVAVHLKPWGRVEGVVEASARRRPIVNLWLEDPAASEYRGRVLQPLSHQRGSLDAEGRFTFEDVPPMDCVVWIHSGPGTSLHHKTSVSVQPGQTAQVRIVSQGPTLRGRFVESGSEAGKGTGTGILGDAISFAYLLTQNPPPPPDRPGGFAVTMEAVEYWRSEAGRAWAFRGRNVRLKVAADGSFTTEEECPPGEYLLRAALRGQGVKRTLVVPEPEEGSESVDLGEVELGESARSESR